MPQTAEHAIPEGAREGAGHEGAGHEAVLPRRRTGSARMTERLLQSADEEFLRHGYEAARVSRIARRADVTSGAVYARWPSKTELLVDALDRALQQIVTERGFESPGDEGRGDEGRGDESPGDEGPSASELTAMLGLGLPSVDAPRDVLVHVFGAAHNNEEIGTLVQGFVNQLAQQRLRLVESAQSAGHCDPDIGTAAGSLFCEAAGIGLRLLLAAGLDGHLVPSTEEWNSLVARLFGPTTVL